MSLVGPMLGVLLMVAGPPAADGTTAAVGQTERGGTGGDTGTGTATGAPHTGAATTAATTTVELELPPQVPEPERREVKIVVAGRPPFVVERDGEVDGISLAIWSLLAERTKLDYEVVQVEDARSALEKVMGGRADVAVGPISITAWRAKRVAFTQPYFQSSLAIMAPAETGLWKKLAPFLSKAFFYVILGLMGVLTLVGSALWIAERRQNPEHFPADPLRGIGNGIWAALVTMTTVGYGDLTPRTLGGRVVTGVWMLVAMLTASSLTASIATVLTLHQLDEGSIGTADELKGKRVAAGRNTPAAEFAARNGARVINVESVEEGVEAIAARRADAVVFDRPILQYYLREHPESELGLSSASYEPTGYGFAAKIGNPLLAELDVALLELDEEGRIERLRSDWISD